jgi:hypothetical protein
MSKLMLQYGRYTDYDKLERLRWDFNEPSKIGGTYLSKLKRPIFFILPKSEILEIYEEPITKIKKLKYIVNADKHKKFVNFLDNLDSLCIELAHQNSSKWFKREIEKTKLVERYNRTYDEDDEVDENGDYNNILDIQVNDINLINELMEYNEDDTNLVISLKGIEFYQKTFQWNINLENVIDEMVIEDDEDSDIEPFELKTEDDHTELINDLTENMNISNKSVDEFVKNNPDSINKVKKIDNKEENQSRIELESIISQKSEDVRRYLINAERARRAADMMHQKAMRMNEELQSYQSRIKYL